MIYFDICVGSYICLGELSVNAMLIVVFVGDRFVPFIYSILDYER